MPYRCDSDNVIEPLSSSIPYIIKNEDRTTSLFESESHTIEGENKTFKYTIEPYS